MNLPVILRPKALTEFEEAAVWYEQQRPGLGIQFVGEVERILELIAEQPDRYPIVFGTIREALVSRFPYCVYYRVRPDQVKVLAVFHTSRDPSTWQRRR